MMDFFYLIPVALALGAAGLAAFMWSLKSGQYEDLDGAAERILSSEDDNSALPSARAGFPLPPRLRRNAGHQKKCPATGQHGAVPVVPSGANS
jgi:cbb3-type cytochrome oxidase maturation protein